MNSNRAVVIALAIGVGLATGAAAQAPASRSGERFEVTAIKAVRPNLVNTVDAVKKGDLAKAKDAFEAYDTAWNGIEVYINTRDKDMYNELEKNYQSKIEEELNAAKPNMSELLSNAQAMLASYDRAIAMVEKAAPMSPLYDDIARIRTARSPLRYVNPAMKEGQVAKAQKAFAAFRTNWPGIRELIKTRSGDAYDAVEKGIPELDTALKAAQPSAEQVAGLVNGMMGKLNGVSFALTTEARK